MMHHRARHSWPCYRLHDYNVSNAFATILQQRNVARGSGVVVYGDCIFVCTGVDLRATFFYRGACFQEERDADRDVNQRSEAVPSVSIIVVACGGGGGDGGGIEERNDRGEEE